MSRCIHDLLADRKPADSSQLFHGCFLLRSKSTKKEPVEFTGSRVNLLVAGDRPIFESQALELSNFSDQPTFLRARSLVRLGSDRLGSSTKATQAMRQKSNYKYQRSRR